MSAIPTGPNGATGTQVAPGPSGATGTLRPNGATGTRDETTLIDPGGCKELSSHITPTSTDHLFRAAQLLLTSKITQLCNSIDFIRGDAFAQLQVPVARCDITVDVTGKPESIWNKIAYYDALHQHCQIYKHDTLSTENLKRTIRTILTILFPQITPPRIEAMESADGKELIVYVRTDATGVLMTYAHTARDLNVSDIFDLNDMVHRAYHAALHAYKMYTGSSTTFPDISTSRTIAGYNDFTKSEDADLAKLTIAATFAATCWRILRSIPSMAKYISLRASNVKVDATNYENAYAAFTIDGVFVPDKLSEILKSLRTGTPNAEALVEYGKFIRRVIAIPMSSVDAPFLIFSGVYDQETIKSEAGVIAKAHLKRYNETKDDHVSVYIRLRASVDRSGTYIFTDKYEYTGLKIGGSEHWNGLSILAQDTSSVVKNNEYLSVEPRPRFTFGPVKRVFMPNDTNEDVAEGCEAIDNVSDILRDGGDVIVMGFGVSGAGKTSTLAWLTVVDKDGRTVKEEEGVVYHWLQGSRVEQIKVTEFKAGGKKDGFVTAITSDKVKFDDIRTVLKYVVNVAIKPLEREKSTPNNIDSSRSHIAVSITLHDGGTLHLVDLAGSEGAFVADEKMNRAMLNNEKKYRVRDNQMVSNAVISEAYLIDNPFWAVNWIAHRLVAGKACDRMMYNKSDWAGTADRKKVAKWIEAFLKIDLKLTGGSFIGLTDIGQLQYETLMAIANGGAFMGYLGATGVPANANATASQRKFTAIFHTIVDASVIEPAVSSWMRRLHDVDLSIKDFTSRLPMMVSVIARISLAYFSEDKLAIPPVDNKYGETVAQLARCVIACCAPETHELAQTIDARAEVLGIFKDNKPKTELGFVDANTKFPGRNGEGYYALDKSTVIKAKSLNKMGLNCVPISDWGDLYDLEMQQAGMQQLTFERYEPSDIDSFIGDILVKTKFVKQLLKTDSDYKLLGDPARYTEFSKLTSAYLTFMFIKTSNVKQILSDKLRTYTHERNEEGTYINNTLREIQDFLVARSIEGNDKIIPDFVENCGEFGCHPLMAQTPCFQNNSVDKNTVVHSTVLDKLNYGQNNRAKVIFMGVVDIGEHSVEPVPWIHDRNLSFLERVSQSLFGDNDDVSDAGMDLLYASVKLPLPFSREGPGFYTEAGDFITYFSSTVDALMDLFPGDIPFGKTTAMRYASQRVRLKVQSSNQATALGILQFLDVMAKHGNRMPCMTTGENVTFANVLSANIHAIVSSSKS